MYLCKFDAEGKRVATVIDGIHFKKEKEKQAYIDQGYIETSAEDYAYYVGNKGNGKNGTGYVRGKDGKPVSAPAHIPTKAEKLAQLEWQYKIDKEKLKNYLVDAILSDDTEVITEIKEEMMAVEAQYQHDREELEGE